MRPKMLVLLLRPGTKLQIDSCQEPLQGLRIQVSKIGYPASDFRIDHFSQLRERRLGAHLDPHISNFLPHPLERIPAHYRLKSCEQITLTVLCRPGMKAEPQKIIPYTWVRHFAPAVLAVHHSCFLRMQCQSACREPVPHGIEQGSNSPLTLAMTNNIVCIALKYDVRMISAHPDIKRIVQIQVGQQRTDDT